MLTLTAGATAGEGTYKTDAEKNIVSRLIDGITFPFVGEATAAQQKGDAFYGALAWTLVGTVLGSKVTRSRLGNDPMAKPVLGFMF